MNLKPDFWKCIFVFLFYYYSLILFGVYGIISIPILYLFASLDIRFKLEKVDNFFDTNKVSKLIFYILRSGILIFTLIFLCMYPYQITASKSFIRMHNGYDSLIDVESPEVIKVAMEIKELNLDLYDISYYLIKKYPGKTDYELWGIDHYPETPLEVIEKGGSDCEGYSIFEKSILKILNNDEEYLRQQEVEEIVVEIKHQPMHSYTLINDEPIRYSSYLDEYSLFDEYIAGWEGIPLLRKIIIVMGSLLIIFRRLYSRNL